MSRLLSSTFGRALELLVPSKAFFYLLPLLLKWILGIESSFHILRSTAGSQAERQGEAWKHREMRRVLYFMLLESVVFFFFIFSPQCNPAGGINFIYRISCWI